MIFKWPSGRLDHWHLFNRKLLYCALGNPTADWHSDGLIDSETVKSGGLGQRCKGKQKARQEALIEPHTECHADMEMYRHVPARQTEPVKTERGRRAGRQVCEDMHTYRETAGLAQSEKPIHPIPVSTSGNMAPVQSQHTHTHTLTHTLQLFSPSRWYRGFGNSCADGVMANFTFIDFMCVRV